MPCYQPFRDDAAQLLLFKIASCLAEGGGGGGGGGGAGVLSFNGRTGVVTLTSGDVTGALGFTPISQADGDSRYVLKAGDTMTGSLNIANSAVLVASDPALDITQTWNNAAVTFTGLNSNITNTASDANSNLFNFQVDGVDRFNFTPGGSFRAVRQDASDSGMNLFLRKRGNVGGATNAVANDSTIGTVAYSGWDGTAFATGSRISGLASEAWTNVAHGSRIDIYATPVGSITESLIFRISSTGVNLTTALAYQYNAVNVIRAQTALNNYFFGPSGNLTMTGTENTVVGSGNAFGSNTTGSANIAIGAETLVDNTTGELNFAIGYRALNNNISGSQNLGMGFSALFANTTGAANVAIGSSSLTSNTVGDSNIAIGVESLSTNTSGASNTAVGYRTLRLSTIAGNNVAVGYVSLTLATGSRNTAVGSTTLAVLTTGTDNTVIGNNSGGGITTGVSNTIIGASVTGLAAGLSNNIIIADGDGVRRINVDSAGLTGINTIVQNSTLHVQGSLALAYVAKTGTYTATVSDYTIDATSGTFTVNLPTAVGITGRVYVVKNSGIGVITVDPAGAETIDGAATQTVAAGASLMVQSTGANWIII